MNTTDRLASKLLDIEMNVVKTCSRQPNKKARKIANIPALLVYEMLAVWLMHKFNLKRH